MSVHKEIVFVTTIVKRLVFNITAERERIAERAKSAIVDGYEYGLPEWVTDRMSLVCDALESGDIQELARLYNISLYDDPRHDDTVVAEYFPAIVSELMAGHYDNVKYEIENIQEVMD